MQFRALVTNRGEDGRISSQVQALDQASLPGGNVAVEVEWSGLNYKDALCLTGGGGLVLTYPHVAGIDLAGRISASDDPRYSKGDRVVLSCWRVW